MTDIFTVPSAQTGTHARGCIAGSYNPDAAPSAGYTPMPADDYQLEIVDSEYTPNAKGTGMVLKTKGQVIGGPLEGRSVYLNYNLENKNEVAEEIGQRDFAALRRATGVLSLEDSEQLHFKPFGVTIGIKARKGTGELENVVKAYHFGPRVEAPPPRGDSLLVQWMAPHPGAMHVDGS